MFYGGCITTIRIFVIVSHVGIEKTYDNIYIIKLYVPVSHMLAHNWTRNVNLILHSGISIDSDYQDKPIISDISVHKGDIILVHHQDGKVKKVSLDTGEEIEVGTLLWIPPKKPLPLVHSLVANSGLEIDDESYVQTDNNQQTNVTNLWAVGDLQRGRWTIDAIYTGANVANSIIREWYG